VEKIGPESDPCFAGGTSGLATFYAYLGAETGSEEWIDLANRLIEHSINALSERPLRPDLYAGFTGIAWSLNHLQGILFDDDEEDDDDPIGEALVRVLDREEPYGIGQFDLIGGLAGYGIYAFHALPRPAARRSLELLVRRLIEIGQPVGGEGFSWYSPPEELPDWQLRDAPNGKFNLGVSHGGLPPDSVVEDRDAILTAYDDALNEFHADERRRYRRNAGSGSGEAHCDSQRGGAGADAGGARRKRGAGRYGLRGVNCGDVDRVVIDVGALASAVGEPEVFARRHHRRTTDGVRVELLVSKCDETAGNRCRVSGGGAED